MKKLQTIALAASFIAFFYQSSPATIYAASASSAAKPPTQESTPAELGASLFRQNCAFCHGRDAEGGETGPDLTRSKLVSTDVAGNKIAKVVKNGRPDKGMPAFTFPDSEIDELVAFIHSQQAKAQAINGYRRGVDVTDLQTGSAVAGKQYFNGAGGCASCHSASGDLAGIASRYKGLQLEQRMLYPGNGKDRVTVTLSSGQRVTGTLAYQDEFTIGLWDAAGAYRSWPTSSVHYSVDSPVEAHADLFSKYSDDDIHNLMAYLQTLR